MKACVRLLGCNGCAVCLHDNMVVRVTRTPMLEQLPAPVRPSASRSSSISMAGSATVRHRPDLVSFSRHPGFGLFGAGDDRELRSFKIDGAPPQGGNFAPAKSAQGAQQDRHEHRVWPRGFDQLGCGVGVQARDIC